MPETANKNWEKLEEKLGKSCPDSMSIYAFCFVVIKHNMILSDSMLEKLLKGR